MLFRKQLTDEEGRLVRMVWRWHSGGKQSSSTPEISDARLDKIIAKLWWLLSKYKAAILEVEEVIDSIENVEDKEGVEESENQKEMLDTSVAKLKEIIEMLEWLRSQRTQKAFNPI